MNRVYCDNCGKKFEDEDYKCIEAAGGQMRFIISTLLPIGDFCRGCQIKALKEVKWDE